MRTIKAKYSEQYIEKLFNRLSQQYTNGKRRKFFVELDGKVITYTTTALEHFLIFLQYLRPDNVELTIGIQNSNGWEHHVLELPAASEPKVVLTAKEYQLLKSERDQFYNEGYRHLLALKKSEAGNALLSMEVEKLNELVVLLERAGEVKREVERIRRCK